MDTDINTSFIESFDKLFSAVKQKKKVAILTHRMPDPDGMGSAKGIQWLLKKKYGLEGKIFFEGVVSHQQNKTMLNILEISMDPFSEFTPDGFDKIVVVDATTTNISYDGDVSVVIDHHRASEERSELVNIESVGAASTLVYELVKGLGLTFEDDLDSKVATALFFGIRNDTGDLVSESSTDRDYQATLELTPYIDRPRLSAVVEYPLPAYFFEAERLVNAEGNYKIDQSYYVGTLGLMSESKRDAIPMIADKMVRMQGVETAVIFAIIGDTLEASVRSKNASIDVNGFCKKIFGKDFSGGKLGAGGASVPLGLLGSSDLPDELRDEWWSVQKKTLFHRILHIASGN